jgi:hypothetical protein
VANIRWRLNGCGGMLESGLAPDADSWVWHVHPGITQAIDAAGNQEAARALQFSIDASPHIQPISSAPWSRRA